MTLRTLPLPLIYLLTLLSPVQAVDKTINPIINAALKLAATNLDRYSTLKEDAAWRFDFRAQASYTFTPGSVVNANAATFPALTGIGMTIAMLNLGPCTMLPPHAHPRATNVVVAMTGNTTSYMVGENGAGVVKAELVPGTLTIFPVGSLHAMQNNSMSSCSWAPCPFLYLLTPFHRCASPPPPSSFVFPLILSRRLRKRTTRIGPQRRGYRHYQLRQYTVPTTAGHNPRCIWRCGAQCRESWKRNPSGGNRGCNGER